MAHRRKSQDDRDDRLWDLWQAAQLNAQAAVGKLPNFKTVLQRTKVFATQSEAQKRNTLAELAHAYGLKVGKTRLIRKAS